MCGEEEEGSYLMCGEEEKGSYLMCGEEEDGFISDVWRGRGRFHI